MGAPGRGGGFPRVPVRGWGHRGGARPRYCSDAAWWASDAGPKGPVLWYGDALTPGIDIPYGV
ncbi:hypothetical protein GCM10027160_05050 [Streptomyces calidiresistens]